MLRNEILESGENIMRMGSYQGSTSQEGKSVGVLVETRESSGQVSMKGENQKGSV